MPEIPSYPLASLQVLGDPNTVDSFAACVCAFARALGRPTDYAFIEGLTGTCFSPCHNTGEECIGWMMDGGNAYRVDFIAEALGLGVEKVQQESGAPEDWLDEYGNTKVLPRQVEAYFGKLEQAQARGEMVVLATWPAWSVLTGWSDDLTQLPFATTPGFEGVVGSIWPPIRTRLAFAFTPNGEPAQLQPVVKAALKFGRQVASGEVALQLPGFDSVNQYGGALYDVILARTAQEHLCPGCQEDGCFGRTAKRLHDGHHASREFLQEAASILDTTSLSKPLDTLQQHYASLQDISSRYLDWHEHPETWGTPEVRRQIRADFEKMRTLHEQAVAQFRVLEESGSL